MRNNLLLAAGLLALPRLGAAQTTAESPRFYVGAGVSVFTAWPFHTGGSSLTGPGLTAGMQLAPRLALQVSPAVAWKRYRNTFDLGSSTEYFSYDDKVTLYSVPVLLRYTFTPGAGPLHFDVLGGATVQFSHLRGSFTRTQNSQIVDYKSYRNTRTNVNLTLGPAVRYSLSPALELTATPLVNFVLNPGYHLDFGDRLTSNFLLGVNYKFGQ